ncbi:Ldh family oxidoreductase [Pseudomonas sp. DCB_BI]|uniref:Ldh family oxidoreductase n=1 Tax=Pseudomonas sp. DCB_BI TaxID=2993594 RepID=UPI00224B6757|nr:Ldh family oxidoreductase [Pseudomonas sp. DCB_BI]MCX2889364.1 Ldh family oxidoreductase [Pseudomonas sp. DCB_BI]
MTVQISVRQAHELAMRALLAAGMPHTTAVSCAQALLQAEREGLPSHGLSRLPFYLEQMATGKVDATAVPDVQVDGALVRVDARHGLAFAAIDAGLGPAMTTARQLGIAALAIGRSHHFGVAGQPVERAAREGLLALALSNAPAAMAPWGGHTPLFGTNPVAFASPRLNADPVVIDLSLSKVARGKVMLARQAGTAIPAGWAIDRQGNDTTDPAAALAGSMVPMGDAKGAALALMVELLTAGLTGSHFGFQASSFFDAQGEAPGVAHLLLLMDPQRFAVGYQAHVEALFAAMLEQPGVRLPGQRRIRERQVHSDVIEVPQALLDRLQSCV